MENTRLLFVYGTLMSTATGAMGRGPRARLDRASRILGPASANGHLYDLGRYPGLVLKRPEGGPPGIAFGELRELLAPQEVFSWLDLYEGIARNDAADGEYIRTVLTVRRAGPDPQPQVPAWVYVYRGSLVGARIISDGAWRA